MFQPFIFRGFLHQKHGAKSQATTPIHPSKETRSFPPSAELPRLLRFPSTSNHEIVVLRNDGGIVVCSRDVRKNGDLVESSGNDGETFSSKNDMSTKNESMATMSQQSLCISWYDEHGLKLYSIYI